MKGRSASEAGQKLIIKNRYASSYFPGDAQSGTAGPSLNNHTFVRMYAADYGRKFDQTSTRYLTIHRGKF